ncbi:HupE/UreJ family protein [Parvularcula sp. IMCC14364]|uniref:HupE/UreJ family protein n=1 Tax=Parvularcula sp. IMCC14364 TaxID=3067902 RepID=UPI0027416880|nr:HupE/UreJ family protein [Parvularcula sp. IMCC14364]
MSYTVSPESRSLIFAGVSLLLILVLQGVAFAHGVEGHDQAFITSADGFHPFPFMYLGAKHMVTGYDHLLYLAGVIFFLQRPQDVIKFVSLFAIGHSITLLFGVLAGIHINAYIVDAIIGLSVCYKALENLGVLKKYTGIALDPKIAVFGFGLVHGFGLSTKLQDLELSPNGLVPNMLSFNIGVEIGQVLALTFLFLLFIYLRGRENYDGISRWANILLFAAGVLLTMMQLAGLLF